MDKSDLILQELRALNSKFNEKFEGVDKKFVGIDEWFDLIDNSFAIIDEKFDKITRVDMDNKDEHIKIRNLLNSINSAF